MRYHISSLIMTNYRQYNGNQEIPIKFDNNKNVVVILGQNGAGKSNILNAITWCLYGIEIHKAKDEKMKEGMPIINTGVLNSLKPNQPVYAEVEIRFSTDNGYFTVQRKIEGGKDAFGKPYVESNSLLTVIYPDGDQDKIVKGPETQVLINNLLPPDLRNFFFLDGEQLRDLFRVSTPQKLSNAIDIVSQLHFVDQANEHLDFYRKSLQKKIGDNTPEIKKIKERINYYSENIERLNKLIENKKEELEKSNRDLILIQDRLQKCNVASISLLEAERVSIEQDLSDLARQKKKNEDGRDSYLVDIAPYIYLKKQIIESYKIILEKVEKGELPPKIKETFVRELLDLNKCICGSPLSDQMKKELEKYCNKLILSELSEVVIDGKNTIRDILELVKEFPNKIDEINSEIDEIDEKISKKARRKTQIHEEISGHDVVEIKRLEERRSELEEMIGGIKAKLKLAERERDECSELLKQKDSELQKAIAKLEQFTDLKIKIDFVQEASDLLAASSKKIKTKIRQIVEKNTRDTFHTLIRKKTVFNEISISDNYIVKIIHSHGYNAINDLSAGEYMILGLSFMNALMSISGFKGPVIIDTPLAKIDPEHRNYIATELPKFLKGTQLIFLVTPSEYDSNVKNDLQSYLIKENFFEIKENLDKTESQVMHYG